MTSRVRVCYLLACWVRALSRRALGTEETDFLTVARLPAWDTFRDTLGLESNQWTVRQ